MFGPTELMIILAIVVVLFGASRVPQLGEAMGKGIRNFKNALGGKNEIDVTLTKDELKEPEKNGAEDNQEK